MLGYNDEQGKFRFLVVRENAFLRFIFVLIASHLHPPPHINTQKFLSDFSNLNTREKNLSMLENEEKNALDIYVTWRWKKRNLFYVRRWNIFQCVIVGRTCENDILSIFPLLLLPSSSRDESAFFFLLNEALFFVVSYLKCSDNFFRSFPEMLPLWTQQKTLQKAKALKREIFSFTDTC